MGVFVYYTELAVNGETSPSLGSEQTLYQTRFPGIVATQQ
jgi:hypothetical protein